MTGPTGAAPAYVVTSEVHVASAGTQQLEDAFADRLGKVDGYPGFQRLEVWRDGVMVGRIARIDPMPAQDLLVIANGDAEVLLPFVRAFVPTVDLQNGRIEITPPHGLFEEPDPVDAAPEPQGAGRRADDRRVRRGCRTPRRTIREDA